ncbi:MAG: cyclase family protein [Alphaproteobacteria bacterium]|nr:cyclase family protein [Alphaproteobacteria bacterium]
MPENPRWKRRPPGSTWGDWGPDDQLGRLNLLTPERVLKGVSEVKEGRPFCLSLPLDYPGGTAVNPRRNPPKLMPTQRNGMPNMVYPLGRDDPRHIDVICDDQVLLTLQYSTQWDSLAHVGQLFDADGDGTPEIVFYNGFRAGEDVIGPIDYSGGEAREIGAHVGAKALSIDNMARKCIQGRGVMIDLEAHFGRGPTFVGYDALMRVLEADKVEIEEGDLVCLRTGYDRVILGMNKNPDPKVLEANPGAGLDGRDERLLNWITKSGLVALISDNVAVEAHPSRPCTEDHCALLPIHAHCLFKLGVYLGEIWHLSELADWLRANGRSRFLLTAPPLRLPGAVGSPANAIATV